MVVRAFLRCPRTQINHLTVRGRDPPDTKYGFEDDVSTNHRYHVARDPIGLHRFSPGTTNLVIISSPSHLPPSFFSGFKNKDVAFFHPESKTLVQADLLFNLPCYEQVCFPPIRTCPSLNPSHLPVLQIQNAGIWQFETFVLDASKTRC